MLAEASALLYTTCEVKGARMKWSPGKIGVVLFSALIALYVGSCSYISETGQKNFGKIRVGDSFGHVLQTMGRPSVTQQQGAEAPGGYGGTRCEAPCVKRVWYLNRGSLMGEAWSFEINADDNVHQAAYWISP